MHSSCRSILLIGNFLSQTNGIQSVSEGLAERLQTAGWKVFARSNKPGRISRLADMLVGILKERDHYALAHVEVYSGSAFVWAELCGFLLHVLKKPFALTLHGGKLPEFSARHPVRVRRLLGRARVVTTPSLYLREALSQVRSGIHYLPNAIEIAHYPYRECPMTGPHLVWLRAFHAIYDPSTAIRCLRILCEDFPQATLTMIGPDKHDGSLANALQLAEGLGIREKIKVVGAIPKEGVPAWLSQDEIFINTSRYESFGVSVMEAAAVGTPIVSTNVGELPRLWIDNQDALLVPPDDAKAMASAIRCLMEDPSLAERLSQNARRKAEQYDWSIVLPQWEELFNEAAAREKFIQIKR